MLAGKLGWSLEITRHWWTGTRVWAAAGQPPERPAGFRVLPRRWVVEQTFGCLQRYRRLRVDDEMSNETSRHTTVLASLFMTGMRLKRMLQA